MVMKGILVEYGGDLLGPIPNIILFQFNPIELGRTIEIPAPPSGAGAAESDQAGEKPLEKISLTAHFDCSDYINHYNPISIAFGIGPMLAALEKMVHPPADNIFDLWGQAVDAIGRLVGGSGQTLTQPIPREKTPQILFIWGLTRVLPVSINSMSINEKHYDKLLNPVRAEVTLELSIKQLSPCSDDMLATGAMIYSNIMKDTQAALNLVNQVAEGAVEIATDIIRF